MALTPWGLPTDPTEQVTEAETVAPAAAPDYAQATYQHHADHIPRSKWDRATWLHQPDPLLMELLVDGTVGLAMCTLGTAAMLGIASPAVAVGWLVFVLHAWAAAVYRRWRYSRRTWPRLYRLAHAHALLPVAGVPKRWVPGRARQRAYLDGREP